MLFQQRKSYDKGIEDLPRLCGRAILHFKFGEPRLLASNDDFRDGEMLSRYGEFHLGIAHLACPRRRKGKLVAECAFSASCKLPLDK